MSDYDEFIDRNIREGYRGNALGGLAGLAVAGGAVGATELVAAGLNRLRGGSSGNLLDALSLTRQKEYQNLIRNSAEPNLARARGLDSLLASYKLPMSERASLLQRSAKGPRPTAAGRGKALLAGGILGGVLGSSLSEGGGLGPDHRLGTPAAAGVAAVGAAAAGGIHHIGRELANAYSTHKMMREAGKGAGALSHLKGTLGPTLARILRNRPAAAALGISGAAVGAIAGGTNSHIRARAAHLLETADAASSPGIRRNTLEYLMEP